MIRKRVGAVPLLCALFCSLHFYCNKVSSTERQSSPLSVLCEFSAHISQPHPVTPIVHPLPSGVLFLHNSVQSARSPFLTLLRANQSSECMTITVHSFSEDAFDHLLKKQHQTQLRALLRSKLLLMECSSSTEKEEEFNFGFRHCLRLLQRISELRLADGLVVRRIFAVLLVYEQQQSNAKLLSRQLQDALLQQQQQDSSLPLSKAHILIISLQYVRKNRKASEFSAVILKQLTFIGALRNACNVISDQKKYLTFSELTLRLLLRWLLAREVDGTVIRCDLQGRLLKAVVTQSFFCEFRTSPVTGELTLLPSLELNAFQMLSEQYRFSYRALDANGSYGRKEGDAWFGSIGYIVNNTADLALCDLIFTSDRAEVVDFSFPYDMQPVSFLTRRPGFKVRKWAFFLALPSLVWLLAVASLLLSGAVLELAVRLQGTYNADKVPAKENHHHQQQQQCSHFIMLFSIFFQQSLPHYQFSSLRRLELRLVVVLWCFASLVLSRLHNGTFYSGLTVPEQLPPLDSVAAVRQAATADAALVFTSRYLFDLAMGAACCDSFEYDLGQHVRRHPGMIAAQSSNFEARIEHLQAYDWARRPPFVFITSQNILRIYEQYVTYELHLSSATFLLDALGIAYQKDALYGPFFTEAIMRMLETGLLKKWLGDTLREHEHRAFELRRQRKQKSGSSSSSSSGGPSGQTNLGSTNQGASESSQPGRAAAEMEARNIHNFRIDEFEAVFILYLAGHVVAGGCFALQLLWWRFFSGISKSQTVYY